MAIEVIGLDLGKRYVHLVGMDGRGKVVSRRRLARGAVVEHLANLPPCLIGMEASGGATIWRGAWASSATRCG